jgi:hypothetical protein
LPRGQAQAVLYGENDEASVGALHTPGASSSNEEQHEKADTFGFPSDPIVGLQNEYGPYCPSTSTVKRP